MMTIKKLLLKSIALFMVTVLMALPLAEINSHTYTVGVSNNYKSFDCLMDYDLSKDLEFFELDSY